MKRITSKILCKHNDRIEMSFKELGMSSDWLREDGEEGRCWYLWMGEIWQRGESGGGEDHRSGETPTYPRIQADMREQIFLIEHKLHNTVESSQHCYHTTTSHDHHQPANHVASGLQTLWKTWLFKKKKKLLENDANNCPEKYLLPRCPFVGLFVLPLLEDCSVWLMMWQKKMYDRNLNICSDMKFSTELYILKETSTSRNMINRHRKSFINVPEEVLWKEFKTC